MKKSERHCLQAALKSINLSWLTANLGIIDLRSSWLIAEMKTITNETMGSGVLKLEPSRKLLKSSCAVANGGIIKWRKRRSAATTLLSIMAMSLHLSMAAARPRLVKWLSIHRGVGAGAEAKCRERPRAPIFGARSARPLRPLNNQCAKATKKVI